MPSEHQASTDPTQEGGRPVRDARRRAGLYWGVLGHKRVKWPFRLAYFSVAMQAATGMALFLFVGDGDPGSVPGALAAFAYYIGALSGMTWRAKTLKDRGAVAVAWMSLAQAGVIVTLVVVAGLGGPDAVLWLLSGVAGVCFNVASTAVRLRAKDTFPDDSPEQRMVSVAVTAMTEFAFVSGPGFVALLGALQFAYDAVVLAAGGVCAVSGLLYWLVAPLGAQDEEEEGEEDEEEDPPGLHELGGVPLLIVWAALAGASIGAVEVACIAFAEVHGYGAESGGWFIAIYALGSVVATAALPAEGTDPDPRWSRFWLARRWEYVLRGWSIIAIALLLLPLVASLVDDRTVATMVLGLGVFAAGWPIGPSLNARDALLEGRAGEEMRTRALLVGGTVLMVGTGAGYLVGTFTLNQIGDERDWGWAIVAASVLAMANAAVAVQIHRHRTSAPQGTVEPSASITG